ncbi:hypothetical protein PQR33_45050, partial [Paraburkholderia sediminicola]
DHKELKERPTPTEHTPKTPHHIKSHYMNPTLTYWSFIKNRPTIQPNTQKAPHRQGKTPAAKRRKAAAKKTGDKAQTMPKPQRHRRRASDTASNQGPLSGPAL